MGYRYHFNVVDKNAIGVIRKATNAEDLRKILLSSGMYKAIDIDDDKNPTFSLQNIGEEVFDFGNNQTIADAIRQKGIYLFDDENMQKAFGENSPYICGREAFLSAIDTIRMLIANMYSSLKSHDTSQNSLTKEEKCAAFINEKLKMWKTHSEQFFVPANEPGITNKIFNDMFLPYDLDLLNDRIVKSNDWEYAIFELVRIYKNIDFDKNAILFIGW